MKTANYALLIPGLLHSMATRFAAQKDILLKDATKTEKGDWIFFFFNQEEKNKFNNNFLKP